MSFTLGNIAAILGGLLLMATGAILLRAATLPTEFRISRSIEIGASPETIIPLIANFHRFNEWNPFLKADPTTSLSYSGPEEGNGAHFRWSGSGGNGIGDMTVTQLSPESVAMDLNFEKPFAARNKVVFGLVPNPSGSTQVSWTMTGQMPFLQRVLSIFLSFDKLLGGQFEKGLADLRFLIIK